MLSTVTTDQIMGIARHVLTFAGGYLAAKGVFNQAALDTLIPAVATLVGAIWSVYSKKPAA